MKLDFNKIKKISAECGFSLNPDIIDQNPFVGVHHHHDWDHGYESGTGYDGKRREFYADMKEIVSFLSDYLSLRATAEFVVAPFHKYNQFDVIDRTNDIYQEILQFLKYYGIRSHSRAGVKLPIRDSWTIIEMLIEGAFRGISSLCLLFPHQNILLAPNHHFDLPFYTKHFKTDKNVICGILKNYPNLNYFERAEGAQK